MFFNPSSISVNMIVTVLCIVMVFLMPWLDRYICGRLGLSLHEGIDTNPDAQKWLVWRKIILILIFILYLLCVAYVTIFSRQTSENYSINSGPLFAGFTNSFYIDFGLLDIINILFSEGLDAALQHISVIFTPGIAQVYMNVAMLIPMGYLLPYIFDWFRRDVSRRTIPVCFLTSVLIENVQLLTRHGMYDLDDIISNTIGGIIGQALFIAVAYVNTHPNWRKELRQKRKWLKKAKETAVFPYHEKLQMLRSTVYTADEESARSFFSDRLGFFLMHEHEENKQKHLLYECGENQIEIICVPKGTPLPQQQIMLAANNSVLIRKRLEEHGIPVSEYQLDDYSGRRTFSLESPDGIRITILES